MEARQLTGLAAPPIAAVAGVRTRPTSSPALRVARLLTAVIVPLAAVASAGGLFIPGLYRDPAAIVPVMQGQDLVTLAALPALVVALLAAGRGSTRGMLAWIGLLGYVLYTYAGAAVAYYLNHFVLIYVALFSLSVFALVAATSSIDVAALQRRFDATVPRGPVVAFLLLTALMLAALALGEIIRFLVTGMIPSTITRAGASTWYPYALDLGLVVPLALLAARWLWRRLPWGYLLAGCILIKAAAMGPALLAMSWFSVRAGLPGDGWLNVVWAVIAGGGLGMSAWFFRHCRG